jgi:hypothetical protein
LLTIQRLVDATVDALQQAPGTGVAHERTLTDSLAVSDVVTLIPESITQGQTVSSPTLTVDEMRSARAWLRRATVPGAVVAGVYGDAIAGRVADGTLDRLGDLLDVAERWLS